MYASVLIPFYNGDKHRDRSVRAVIKSALNSLESDSELIVAEQVTKTDLSEFSSDPRFKHILVGGSSWNKSTAWNEGFKHTKGEAIIGLDADIIAPEDFFKKEYVNNAVSSSSLHYPFVDIVDMTISETNAYCESTSFLKHIDVSEQANRLRNGRRCFGGIWIMHRDTFVDVGGYDRSFEIWGGEDDIFHWICTARFTRSAVTRGIGVIYHLWHPVSNTKEYLESDAYKAVVNRKQAIMQSYNDSTNSPKYCKVQRFINGLAGL